MHPSHPVGSTHTFSRASVWRTTLAIGLWTLLVAGGFRQAIRFEVTAGAPGHSPGEWPDGSPVKLDRSKNNLVMLAHPKCPCTRASLAELVKVLTAAQGTIKATVLFYMPSGEADWANGNLLETAQAIPGVHVIADPDARWAKQFGAETSGHVVLFDRDGHLLFRGGITGARGHEGANAGERAVVEAALHGMISPESTPVFGCSLSAPALSLTTQR